jgi:hypothetical protein
MNTYSFWILSIKRMYSYQPEGWLDPHTVLAPDAHNHTPMHTLINTHTAYHIPPPRGVLNQELKGVGWPVPFPLRTAHEQAMMKCITSYVNINVNLAVLRKTTKQMPLRNASSGRHIQTIRSVL